MCVIQQVFLAGGPVLVDSLEEMIGQYLQVIYVQSIFNSLLFSPSAISLIMFLQVFKVSSSESRFSTPV